MVTLLDVSTVVGHHAMPAALLLAYNLVIECAEKSGAQVLRVRFFLSLNRHKLLTERNIIYHQQP